MAAHSFFEALARESPRWLGKSAAPPIRSSAPRFFIHQSRFRVGNTLWLTPQLRAIRRHFPQARITVAGSPTTARVLNHVPLVDEMLVFDPGGGIEEQNRFLRTLRARRFDAAIFALVRRQKSRWLAEAVADMETPCRINLEYFEAADLQESDLFTHEGWFFWCAIASASFLLHGLQPFIAQRHTSGGILLDDRSVEFPVQQAWRQEAEEVLADRGIGTEPFVLFAPGGASSQRWPTRNFAALAVRLAEELGLHVIIEGGPADRQILERTTQWINDLQLSSGSQAKCIASQDSLGVLAALLERSSLLVSNDSAAIHLAEATGTPTLYFSHHEKLTHSHPSNRTHWALYDVLENRIANISVENVLSTIGEMVKRGDIAMEHRGRDRSSV